MGIIQDEDLGITNTSEFTEAYEAEPTEDQDGFSAELLSRTLEDIGTTEPVCVTEDARVGDVVQGLADRNHGCVLVTKDGVLTGIFTERDVLRRVYGHADPSTPIGEVMTRDPEAVAFHDTIAVALNKMTVGGFRHVPLVDITKKPVGVVSVRDIVNFLVEQFPRHVLSVAPNPDVRKPDVIGS
ncbi:MAG: CBS domain-containing protein [Deltaproteobacteria bacterium]|jgi:CBS domain-containing protein